MRLTTGADLRSDIRAILAGDGGMDLLTDDGRLLLRLVLSCGRRARGLTDRAGIIAILAAVERGAAPLDERTARRIGRRLSIPDAASLAVAVAGRSRRSGK